VDERNEIHHQPVIKESGLRFADLPYPVKSTENGYDDGKISVQNETKRPVARFAPGNWRIRTAWTKRQLTGSML